MYSGNVVIFHLSYRIRFIILCFFPRENTAKVYIRAREQFPVYNFRRPLSFSSLSYPVRFGRAFPARRATRNQRSGDKFPCARARAYEWTGQWRFRVHRKCASRLVRSRISEVESRAQMFARDAYCRPPPRFLPPLSLLLLSPRMSKFA